MDFPIKANTERYSMCEQLTFKQNPNTSVFGDFECVAIYLQCLKEDRTFNM